MTAPFGFEDIDGEDGHEGYIRIEEPWDEVQPRDIQNGSETLMQYTGLKDKNGREIYEGDVLAFSNSPEIPKGHVHFKDGGWRVLRNIKLKTDWINDTYLRSYTKRHVVIGNIYENPELLK
jgi:uncharacterized phage protein (TIGR01671 family)